MDDEPKIITVGKPQPAPDVAKWLREQPHERSIILCCTDEASARQDCPISPSAFRCIDASVVSRVDGRMAGARVRIADHQASDPVALIRLIIEEAEAAFADLGASP